MDLCRPLRVCVDRYVDTCYNVMRHSLCYVLLYMSRCLNYNLFISEESDDDCEADTGGRQQWMIKPPKWLEAGFKDEDEIVKQIDPVQAQRFEKKQKELEGQVAAYDKVHGRDRSLLQMTKEGRVYSCVCVNKSFKSYIYIYTYINQQASSRKKQAYLSNICSNKLIKTCGVKVLLSKTTWYVDIYLSLSYIYIYVNIYHCYIYMYMLIHFIAVKGAEH